MSHLKVSAILVTEQWYYIDFVVLRVIYAYVYIYDIKYQEMFLFIDKEHNTHSVKHAYAMNGNIPVAVRCMFQLPVIFQFPGTRKFKYHKSKFPITFYVMRAIFIYGPLSLTQVNFNPSMDK